MPFKNQFKALALQFLALSLSLAAFDIQARPSATPGEPFDGADIGSPTYASRDDVMLFAEEVAQRQGLEASWVRAALQRSRYIPSVARLVMPAPRGTAKDWRAYRRRFIEPVRIRAGLAFWQANQRWLDLAHERFGVPPEIVVGIIGVETIFGRHMGSFRVIDALATLAFDFPSGRSDRSAMFRDELEQFLMLCRKQDVNPLDWRGSYAGAIGMPQFLPSSFNKYAVDLDGDGRIDLHDSAADVIGSVANYLMAFGWQRGMATHFEVAPPADAQQRAVLLAPDILPSFRGEEFAMQGASLGASARSFSDLLALVELENGDDVPSYVAGTANFYAVTRYNRSSYYALAVIELGEAIARERLR